MKSGQDTQAYDETAESIDRRQMFRRAAVIVGGVVAATALPSQAMAADADIVHVGQWAIGSSGAAAISAHNTSTGAGVHGESDAHDGVRGFAKVNSKSGVYGNNSAGGAGVWGESASGKGVVGMAAGLMDPGVYGENTRDSGGVGVEGVAHGGVSRGVEGSCTNGGIGVYGHNNTATGVWGSSNTGTGVQATSNTGVALEVGGIATFSRSGKAKISKGEVKRTVTVPYTLADNVMILCTLQDTGGAGVVLRYAQRTSSTQFKIVLNKACTENVYAAYLILG